MIADESKRRHHDAMSYRLPSRRNWGVLVACVVGVPLGLAWGVVGIVGGALICADQSSDCRGIV